MIGYLQYKAFNTIDELNEWLQNFKTGYDKTNSNYIYCHDGQMDTLRNVQFLGSATVDGDDDTVAGEAHFYPVAQYSVTMLGQPRSDFFDSVEEGSDDE